MRSRKAKDITFLTILVFYAYTGFVYAVDEKQETKQNQTIAKEIEKVNEQIQKLRQDMDQSYYSVPKKEFEKVTVQNITQEVSANMNEKFNFWRNIALFIITVSSFLGIRQLGRLKEDIQKNIDDKTALLRAESKLGIKDDMSAEMVKISKVQGEELSKILAKISSEIEPAKEEIKFLKSLTLKTELDRLILDEKKFTPKDLISRMDSLLKKAIELKDKRLVNDYLDELFRLTFLSTNYEELDKLRVQYEKDYEFKETTWTNIAIGDMFLYEENNSQIYKERALRAYKNALEGAPDYGTAHAVRLIIYMIDYERELDQENKEKEKEEALKLLNIINSGSRFTTSYETFDYFKRTPVTFTISKHIDMLYVNFPEQMKNMEGRYNEQLDLLNKQNI